jgi:hypothetical protein
LEGRLKDSTSKKHTTLPLCHFAILSLCHFVADDDDEERGRASSMKNHSSNFAIHFRERQKFSKETCPTKNSSVHSSCNMSIIIPPFSQHPHHNQSDVLFDPPYRKQTHTSTHIIMHPRGGKKENGHSIKDERGLIQPNHYNVI